MSLLVESTTIPVEMKDCVKQSVIDIFTSMCGFQPEFQRSSEREYAFDGFIGAIAFFGDLEWLLFLGLPYDSSRGMATRFAGFEIDLQSDDMDDVVGEMANIIAGDIVARMEAIGWHIRISTPSVARGSNMHVAVPEGTPPVQLHFDSPDGEFWVKYSVKV